MSTSDGIELSSQAADMDMTSMASYMDTINAVQQVSETGAFESVAPPLKMALFFGALSLFAMALVCVTSFTRIIIVLSFVRRALTTQEIPPNPVLIGLAFFLTTFTMGPTLDAVFEVAIDPYVKKELSEIEALNQALPPLRDFMFSQTRTSDIELFMEMADIESFESEDDVPLRILIPAYMIRRIKNSLHHGILYLRSLRTHRPTHIHNPDVFGNDDDASRGRLSPNQAFAFCSRRWMATDRNEPWKKLPLTVYSATSHGLPT